MQKILSFVFAAIMLLMLGSCDTYAQFGTYEDEIVYEYSYAAYPVRYINGLPYYYAYYNGIWTWLILPRTYYPHIRHHYPMRYHRPPTHYNRPNTYRPNPYRHGPVHPDTRPNPHRGTYGQHRSPSRGGFGGAHKGGGNHFGGRR